MSTNKNKKKFYTPGQFEVIVEAGSKVSLYLNSDASTDWRTTPLYAVTARDKDMVIRIAEKEGKHTDSDTPTLAPTPAPPPKDDSPAPNVIEYTAPLTGDIWMKASHKYTAAEVDSRVPSDTSKAVLAAVKSIYTGLSKAELKINIPAAGTSLARSLTVKFEDSDNPKSNINAYTLLGDGLTRVHPGGYAEIFKLVVA